MMGMAPSEAKSLTYWEYTAMRHEWNERQSGPDAPDDDEDFEPPTPDFVRAKQERLIAMGLIKEAG